MNADLNRTIRSPAARRALQAAMLALISIVCVPARSDTLTLATYNVENYLAADRLTEDGFRRDYPKPEAQKRALRKVLLGLNADVLVLQEMGGEPYLYELRRDLRQAGLEYPHAVLLTAADSDRHQVLLSKRPLLSTTSHARVEFPCFGQKETVKRGVLEAQIATAAGTLTLFGVHLKSQYTERTEDPRSALWRLGEATAIRDLIQRRVANPDSDLFMMLGDFNDDKSSKPVQRLLRRGKHRMLVLLPAADSRGDTWTYLYRRQDSYTRVDHVLVSRELATLVVGRIARIYDGEGVREASDHRPVMVTLELPERSDGATPENALPAGSDHNDDYGAETVTGTATSPEP